MKNIDTMNNIGQKLRALRKKLGITQAECSKRMGFVRNYISLVETGYKPSRKFIKEMERLEQGELPEIEQEPGVKTSMIPLLTWAQAGTTQAWKAVSEHEGISGFNVRDPKAVAVQIRGDGMAPQFPQGTIAIVYPSWKAKSGDLVIARLNDGTVLFKRLHVDGDSNTFISLNPIYPPMTVDKAKVEMVLPVGGTFQDQL
jgi:SOS-response transcriptional repressor LexA